MESMIIELYMRERRIIIDYLKKKRKKINFINNLLRYINGRPRVCIRNYIGTVVGDYSEAEFRRHFRISRSLFNDLIEKYKGSSFNNSPLNIRRISAEVHLAMFLWFAGHECCSFRQLSDRFNLSLSSVHFIVNKVIQFLSNMAKDVILWSTDDEKIEISEHFMQKSQFPSVIGENRSYL